MGQRLDIAIVGAGIGGLAAGALLARQGHAVRVFDQFETPRPIGSGLMLQQTGLAVLSEMGLRDEIDALGSRIDRLWGLTQPLGRAVLDVRYTKWKPDLYGLGVQRGMVFERLLDAARASGVELVPNTVVQDTAAPLDGHDVTIMAYGARPFAEDGKRVGDLPYGALWATLPWPQDAPFDKTALEQRYRHASQMTGVMASGRLAADTPETLTYFWSIRGDREADWRAEPLDAWKARAETLWPETRLLLDQFTSHDDLTFARYRHFTHKTPVISPSLVYLGDAWHSASPQLGQGANMALLDAWALAKAFEETQDKAEALAQYLKLRRYHVRLYQLMTWAFTPVYQGDSRILPWLRDWLAAPMSRIWPGPQILAALVSGSIGRPLNTLGLKR